MTQNAFRFNDVAVIIKRQLAFGVPASSCRRSLMLGQFLDRSLDQESRVDLSTGQTSAEPPCR